MATGISPENEKEKNFHVEVTPMLSTLLVFCGEKVLMHLKCLQMLAMFFM